MGYVVVERHLTDKPAQFDGETSPRDFTGHNAKVKEAVRIAENAVSHDAAIDHIVVFDRDNYGTESEQTIRK